MALREIVIDNIFGGIQPTEYFSNEGEYLAGIGIDPDMPKDDSSRKLSGLLRPTALSKFSSTEVTGAPMWIKSNPKDTNAYVYANDGKVHVVTSSLAMGTALNSGSAMTSATGNGSEYYDNAMYFAKNTDIARYHPLDGTPSLTQDYFTNTLSLAALTDTTYPSIQGTEMPNHSMLRHTDDALYICDVNSDGTGVLHKIKTTKTTDLGDTDDGSAREVLDLDNGYYPTAIEGRNNEIIIGAIEGVNTSIRQKPFALVIWDALSSSFSTLAQHEFADPIVSAIKNVNGIIYVFSGSATSAGCRVSRLISNYTLQEVAYLPDAFPPFQGAVDSILNKVLFGGYTEYPDEYGLVHSLGSRSVKLGEVVHGAYNSTATKDDNPIVTSLLYFEQNATKGLQPIVGWKDDTDEGLDKITTTYTTSIWRSRMINTAQPYDIKEIHIPLTQAVAANMTLTVKVFVDDESSNTTVKTINSTNFPNSERNIIIRPNVRGTHNFFIELTWSGTALLTVGLPIKIIYEEESRGN